MPVKQLVFEITLRSFYMGPFKNRLSFLNLLRFQWSLTLVGLCIFTFAIITFRFPVAQLGIALAGLGLILDRKRLKAPFLLWLYAAFLLWAFAASFTSRYQDIALDQLLEHLKLIVIMFVVINSLRTKDQLRFYLLFFLGCFVLFPLRGAFVNYVGGYNVFGRALWNYIYANPNDLAALAIIALGVALAIVFPEHRRSVVWFGATVSALLLLLLILLTQSRGAFIGLAVGMSTATIRLLLRRPSLTVPTLLVALLLSFMTPNSVWDRLSGIGQLTSVSNIDEADHEGSAAQRFEIQKVAWQIFIDHPIFGVGMGAYKEVNARYAPFLGRKDTHNTYLNLAAEVGLPGLLLWCALFGSVMRHAYRSRQGADLSEPLFSVIRHAYRTRSAKDAGSFFKALMYYATLRRRNSDRVALATQQSWIERGLASYLVAGLFGTFSALTFPYLMLAVLWCSASILSRAPLPAANRAIKGMK
jgi:O-antigen ligase